VSTRDILAGKTLAAVIPSMAITWASFIVYAMLVDTVTYPIFGYPVVPDLLWLIALTVTAPLLAVMSVYLSIVVSSRMSDIRAAQQISAVFIVPLMSIFILELFGYMSLTVDLLLLLSIAIGVADLFLMRAGVSVFKREEILTRSA